MKRSLLIAFCLVLCASMAFAQRDLGSIDVFTDLMQTSCDFTDDGTLIQVHVFVTHANDGTTASQWMLKVPSGWIHLGDLAVFETVLGTSVSGIGIAYGQCMTGDFLILTANFTGTGNTPACSYISIIPDPSAPSGEIEIVDCQLPNPAKQTFLRLGQGIVSGDGTCNCTIPVQETTWGQVKALYR